MSKHHKKATDKQTKTDAASAFVILTDHATLPSEIRQQNRHIIKKVLREEFFRRRTDELRPTWKSEAIKLLK